MLRLAVQSRDRRIDQFIDAAVGVGVLILIVAGFATSYRTLLELAVTVGGYPPWLAPAVPLSFDLGIVVLSLKVAQAAREGRRAPVLRLLVMALSGATVVANASAVPGLAGRVLHAVPPAMFVVCFESVIITARQRALRTNGAQHTGSAQPGPQLWRWVLAPRNTWRTWRAAVLAGEGPGNHVAEFTKAADPLAAAPLAPGAQSQVVAGPMSSTPLPAKLEMAVDALREDPQLKAAQLQEALLLCGGIEVSLRTAQRLHAAARRQLTLGSHHANDPYPEAGGNSR